MRLFAPEFIPEALAEISGVIAGSGTSFEAGVFVGMGGAAGPGVDGEADTFIRFTVRRSAGSF